MTAEKKGSAQNNYFAFIIIRPISYVLTIPFLYADLSPNAISLLSVLPVFLGFFLAGIATDKPQLIAAWLCFFIWNLLDSVDGNVARYRKQFTTMGSVFDAMSGYFAMALMYFAFGIAAGHHTDREFYLILGGLSGIFAILPRLIMHKAKSELPDFDTSGLNGKADFSPVRILILNLTSIAGLVQVFLLAAILLDLLDLFTWLYFLLNSAVMTVSLYTILKQSKPLTP
jgi:phosphatidylglycerophosphate synthase